MQHRVPDHEVERVVVVRDRLGIGDAALDLETEALRVALRGLDHAGRDVGDMPLIEDPRLLQVQQEEAFAYGQPW